MTQVLSLAGFRRGYHLCLTMIPCPIETLLWPAEVNHERKAVVAGDVGGCASSRFQSAPKTTNLTANLRVV